MAHSLSAKKRIRQNIKSRMINRGRKSAVKAQIKKFEDAIASGQADVAKTQFTALTKSIDQVAATSTMHKNTASRMKSRLAKKLNAMKA
ncbi:MAG: 30S ribosomal protein S20 [Planctomycetes bacterium]|nr:30S ribosomal protein S20 [Planctomycetota bacterium]